MVDRVKKIVYINIIERKEGIIMAVKIRLTRMGAKKRPSEEVAMKWLRNGAVPTDTVRNLFSEAGIMKKFAEEKDKKEA